MSVSLQAEASIVAEILGTVRGFKRCGFSRDTQSVKLKLIRGNKEIVWRTMFLRAPGKQMFLKRIDGSAA
jgi:hypothetical protein